jgi:hypothetical protein
MIIASLSQLSEYPYQENMDQSVDTTGLRNTPFSLVDRFDVSFYPHWRQTLNLEMLFPFLWYQPMYMPSCSKVPSHLLQANVA